MTNQSAPNLSAFAAQLRGYIQRHSHGGVPDSNARDDGEFDLLARALFQLQFDHNHPYRQFCESRQATPPTIRNWRDIPAMPTSAFKELELTSIPPQQCTGVFHSSGTTEQRPSRHFHSADSLALYEASLLPWFGRHNPSILSFIFLTPPSSQAPNSSLVHMLETIRREFRAANSAFTGYVRSDGAWDLDLKKTLSLMRASIASRQPVMLFGTAFGFVHLLDHLQDTETRLHLPPGSCILETGGYKGRSRELPKAELHALISDWLGIPARQIICEYGMSELSSQAYDAIAGAASNAPRVFRFPPWARAQIISPETVREVAIGETGLIRIFDLANVYSVMAIQTEDLGIRRDGGFELLGRAVMAEPRGCSLASV